MLTRQDVLNSNRKPGRTVDWWRHYRCDMFPAAEIDNLPLLIAAKTPISYERRTIDWNICRTLIWKRGQNIDLWHSFRSVTPSDASNHVTHVNSGLEIANNSEVARDRSKRLWALLDLQVVMPLFKFHNIILASQHTTNRKSELGYRIKVFSLR